jgi:uncharacterized protein (TIGR03437 family)
MFFAKALKTGFCLVAATLISVRFGLSQTSTMVCQATSAPLQVRIEGRTERVGDITLNCQGGSPGTTLNTNLVVTLNRNITNKVDNNVVRNVVLLLDQGDGLGLRPVSIMAMSGGPSSVLFNGVNILVPASRQVVLRVSQIRADVSVSDQPVLAFVSFNGPASLSVDQAVLTVAQPRAGFLAFGAPLEIKCAVSAFPTSAFTLTAAVSERKTLIFTARATEGFEAAFNPKQPDTDTGDRIAVRYSGFPAGTQLAVPDVIAGSDATQATSAGDLGKPVSAGQYTPGGNGSLLLVRILGTDANGAGGFPAISTGQPLPFDTLREVAITNGVGIAVYEVVDANPFVRESAQIPTFLQLTKLNSDVPNIGTVRVNLGPLSTATTSGPTTPIPRFADVTPQNDCSAIGDCGASYFPVLFVDTTAITGAAPAGGNYTVNYVRIRNEGGGQLIWTAQLAYQSGTQWIHLDQMSGINNGTIRADLHPESLTPGTYQAALTIDAGQAGSRVIPITFTVTPRAAPAQGPSVDAVMHAASFEEVVVPGSLGVVKGARLNGTNVGVTLGGVVANVLYDSAEQINFEAPAALAGSNSADLVVTVDGVASAAKTVNLSPVLPGIFAGGIINSTGEVNSDTQPAKIGDVIRILVTGIPESSLGTVRVRIHDQLGLIPVTAAAMPGSSYIQYVDVVVPDGLPAQAEAAVCASAPGADADAPMVCSLPAKVNLVQ